MLNFKRVLTEGAIHRKTIRTQLDQKGFAVRGNHLFRRSRQILNMLFIYVKAEHFAITHALYLLSCSNSALLSTREPQSNDVVFLWLL